MYCTYVTDGYVSVYVLNLDIEAGYIGTLHSHDKQMYSTMQIFHTLNSIQHI